MMNAYMTDTITLKTATTDKWGSKTFVSATMKARIEFKTKLVRNLQGEQVVATAKLYLPKTVVVSHADVISYAGKDYSILNIGYAKDFSNRFLLLDLA